MSRRLNVDAGPLVTIAGSLLLFVSLFLDWYEPGVSAWTVFEVIDLLLALSALVAIVISVELIRPGLLPIPAIPRAERLVVTAGTVALVLVSSQLLNHPPAAQHEAVKLGAWLGLAGAAVMFARGGPPVPRGPPRGELRPPPPAAPPPPPAP